ncbi:hypothetical protein BDD12DRAFT_305181 [Trichophaea hybrida]|nr:hypothetical protein BDD12DRAFT_305181 [Trichophaea hybrida]
MANVTRRDVQCPPSTLFRYNLCYTTILLLFLLPRWATIRDVQSLPIHLVSIQLVFNPTILLLPPLSLPSSTTMTRVRHYSTPFETRYDQLFSCAALIPCEKYLKVDPPYPQRQL